MGHNLHFCLGFFHVQGDYPVELWMPPNTGPFLLHPLQMLDHLLLPDKMLLKRHSPGLLYLAASCKEGTVIFSTQGTALSRECGTLCQRPQQNNLTEAGWCHALGPKMTKRLFSRWGVAKVLG